MTFHARPFPRPPWSVFLRLTVAVMLAALAFEAMHALWGLGGRGLNGFVDNGLYLGVETLATLLIALRSLTRRRARAVWALMALGAGFWTAGDLTWTLWLDHVADPPYPSVADGLYLGEYAAMYPALMLLLRVRIPQAGAAQWLDGGVVALTATAFGAGIVLPSVAHDGHVMQDAVNLAYPIGDLTLLAFVLVAFSLSGWRLDRVWLLLGAGVTLSAIVDLIYLYELADGTYVAGGILDVMWPASMSVLALAAWQPHRRVRIGSLVAPHTIAITSAAGAAALGLLVYATFTRVHAVTVILAAAALGLTSLRALLTYRENIRMLRTSAREAVTDGLTGLGNRRRLMLDLDAALGQCAEHPMTLAFFDLNGFKRYNDSFGHAAGDQLLSRLGAALRLAAGAHGHAYRLGGDEFCLLLEGRFTREDPVVAQATAALGEGGAGFSLSAAVGLAVAPDDGRSATTILQLADQRMYFDKVRLTHRTRSATHQVLMTVLDERTPSLHTHVHGVGQLALAIGQEFGLQADALRELHRAAELHDVGKLAIPDQILGKPGPLDEDEWAFIRQHTTIGQRILDADPALRAVGRLVRASHERWDGNGYPDGLAADHIPLPARIIAACDAYEAITATRCYQPARGLEQAVAELQRHAGTQFDPAVVEVLCRIVTQKRIPGSAGDAHVVAPEPWGRAQVA